MSVVSSQFLLFLFLFTIGNFFILHSVLERSGQWDGDGGEQRMLSATTENLLLNGEGDAPRATTPYYLEGKTKYKETPFHQKRTFRAIAREQATRVNEYNDRIWVLADPIQTPTRNHESVILEYGKDNNQQVMINVLGRWSRVVQWMNLQTGEQFQVETKGTDPDNRPLNDLNHVASVLVDSIDSKSLRKEIWLPCGFHNDRIGNEHSSNYVRIIDLETMRVRYGPKLPYSGGACGAAAIEAIPGEPPLICAFGGTDGNHDKGE
jgi:hypothetical protein